MPGVLTMAQKTMGSATTFRASCWHGVVALALASVLMASVPALGQLGEPILIPGVVSGGGSAVDRGDNGACPYQPPGGYNFSFGGLGTGSRGAGTGGPGAQSRADGVYGFDTVRAKASVNGIFVPNTPGRCPLQRGAGSAYVTAEFGLRKAAIVEIVSDWAFLPGYDWGIYQGGSRTAALPPTVRGPGNYAIGASVWVAGGAVNIPSWNVFAEAEFRVLAPCTEITLQPGITWPCPGQTGMLSVEVVGKGPFTYQWYREGGVPVNSPGTLPAAYNDSVHRATLVIPNIALSDYGRYYVAIETPLGLCTNVVSNLGTIAAPGLLAGVCCDTTSSACRVSILGCCEAHETFVNAGACEPSPCPEPVGRCCFPGGDCCVLRATACPPSAFFTPGTTCGDNVCIRITQSVSTTCGGSIPSVPTVRRFSFRASQACCNFTTGACVVLAPGLPCAPGFEPLLGKVTCDPVACPEPPSIEGACCVGGFCSLVTNVEQCQGAGMRFAAGVTTCDPAVGGPACCGADVDATGSLGTDDLFTFLNLWFEGSDPRADFSGDGEVSIQDIFSFLNAWFAGC